MAHLPVSELQAIVAQANEKLGGKKRWRHKASGDEYRVTGVALEEKTHAPVVKYVGKPKIPWTRPLEEFLEKFSPQ